MAKKKLTVEKSLASELTTVLNTESPKASVVKFKLSEDASVPEYAHDGDMGMDVVATDIFYDDETGTYIYSTGIKEETVKGVGCLGFARSSVYRKDCRLTNGVGVIDSAIYRGEIKFIFKPDVSLDQMAMNLATRYIATLPWWKKFLKTQDELQVLLEAAYAEYYEDLYENVMDYAPYEVGDKIGQLVFIPYLTMTSEIVSELSDSVRGENGHGSTGDKKKK